MHVMVINARGCADAEPTDIPRLLTARKSVLWVDMIGPTAEDIRVMAELFQFHPLAIEDTTNHQQRPKIEHYPKQLFMILNSLGFDDKEIRSGEIDVFVGSNYVVTVHHKDEAAIEETRRRLERSAGQLITSGYVMYVLLDAIIDDYFPVLDTVADEIEKLEDEVLERPSQDALNRLFGLKRALIDMWRVVWPKRDMISVLGHQMPAYIDAAHLTPYLRDVADHLLWIADMVNTFRDTTSSIMDLYMSSVSNYLNRVVNRLAVVTVAIGLLTVISGFYGMNFLTTWPPFSADWGVPFVLGLMLLVTVATLLIFKKLKWY
jgi:magnesium transporter